MVDCGDGQRSLQGDTVFSNNSSIFIIQFFITGADGFVSNSNNNLIVVDNFVIKIILWERSKKIPEICVLWRKEGGGRGIVRVNNLREERKDRDNREWKKHEPRQKGRVYLFVGRKKLGEKIQVSAESWRRNQSKNLKHKTFLFFFSSMRQFEGKEKWKEWKIIRRNSERREILSIFEI